MTVQVVMQYLSSGRGNSLGFRRSMVFPAGSTQAWRVRWLLSPFSVEPCRGQYTLMHAEPSKTALSNPIFNYV